MSRFRHPITRLIGRFLPALCLAVLSFVGPLTPALADDTITAPDDPTTGAQVATTAPYWIANPAGDVWNFGSAKNYGSLADVHLNKPIVGMAPTPTAQGYWLVATDGGIFSFGDAKFFGSAGSIRLNKPIVAMAPTPTGKGYWLVASDGGIFTFGDAKFFGSTGSIRLNKPIVGVASTTSSKGYWLVAADGGIFTFGDAKFYGSAGGGADQSFSKVVPSSDAKGYWLLRGNGDVIGYGSVASSVNANYANANLVNASPVVDPGSSAMAVTRPAVALIHNINGPGDLAIEYALEQMGKPYAWGGAGPDSFDCSGLTLRAWQVGGTTIPRVAADQYNFGRRVPLTSLVPGDLVFWAYDVTKPETIHHVALYVGGGSMVNAPYTGTVVRIGTVVGEGLMPFAVRPRG